MELRLVQRPDRNPAFADTWPEGGKGLFGAGWGGATWDGGDLSPGTADDSEVAPPRAFPGHEGLERFQAASCPRGRERGQSPAAPPPLASAQSNRRAKAACPGVARPAPFGAWHRARGPGLLGL